MRSSTDFSQENEIRAILAERNPYQLDLGGLWLERVFAAYRQPHRYFHTLSHLLSICRDIREHTWDDQQLSAELLLTALFHDVVWYPQGNDSEERSCEAFLHILGAMGNPIPAEAVDRITQAILSTCTQENVSPMAAQFHDFDCQ